MKDALPSRSSQLLKVISEMQRLKDELEELTSDHDVHGNKFFDYEWHCRAGWIDEADRDNIEDIDTDHQLVYYIMNNIFHVVLIVTNFYYCISYSIVICCTEVIIVLLY